MSLVGAFGFTLSCVYIAYEAGVNNYLDVAAIPSDWEAVLLLQDNLVSVG